MNITARNFFRLLRAGLFGQEEPIEPMSAWKWQQLYGYACMHHVSAIVLVGIERCSGQFFLQLPEALHGQWKLTVAQLTTENEQTSQCLTELTALFGRMQLRPIILGGQAMGQHYQPSTNHHPDGIDIFFPFETQGKKADQQTVRCDCLRAQHPTDRQTLYQGWKGRIRLQRENGDGKTERCQGMERPQPT